MRLPKIAHRRESSCRGRGCPAASAWLSFASSRLEGSADLRAGPAEVGCWAGLPCTGDSSPAACPAEGQQDTIQGWDRSMAAGRGRHAQEGAHSGSRPARGPARWQGRLVHATRMLSVLAPRMGAAKRLYSGSVCRQGPARIVSETSKPFCLHLTVTLKRISILLGQPRHSQSAAPGCRPCLQHSGLRARQGQW